MISARRLQLDDEAQNLAEGSGGSGVSIQLLRNKSDEPIFLGDPDDPEGAIPLDPGEQIQGLTLGSVDRLHVWRAPAERDDEDRAPLAVDLIVGWA